MPPSRNLGAILTMLAAVALLSVMDAGLKLLAPHYPPMQIAALRALASWPLALAWVLASGGLGSLLRVRWPLHLLRGALGILMLPAFIYALGVLPLATVYTLFFVAPLMIAALSGPLLGERVDRSRWAAIAIGFAGVIVALRPTGEGLLTWAGLAVLAAAAGYALSAITVRVLGRTDSTQSLVFWMLTMGMVGAGLLALPGWVPIRPGDGWTIAGIGVVGFLGQYAITVAFARGEAAVIAPLDYTALAWGLAFDWWWWATLPDAMTLTGAAIIVASGLFLIRRERPPPALAQDPA